MGKYDFRLSGELEYQFLEFIKMTRFSKSALVRECIKIGLLELTTKGALEKLRYDQTHGWEVTRYPSEKSFVMYQDIKGRYHIPFEIFEEGAIVKDLVDLRDGKKCRKCGKNHKVIYHYIDGDENNQSLENVVTLCEKCFSEVTNFCPKKYKKRLFAIWFYLTNPKPVVFKREID